MHLYGIYGTPSKLTDLLLKITIYSVTELFQECMHHEIIDTEQLNKIIDSNKDNKKPIIFYSSHPKRGLIDHLAKMVSASVIVIEDLFEVAEYVIEKRKLDPRNAIRFTSQSASTLYQLSLELDHLRPYYILHQSLSDKLVKDYLNFLFPNINQVDIEKLMLKISNKFHIQNTPVSIGQKLSTTVACNNNGLKNSQYSIYNLIRDSLSNYNTLFTVKSNKIFYWPTQLFHDHRDLKSLLHVPQQMLGPARIMFGGHTMHVPQGKWNATIEIEVFNNLSGNTIVSEIYVGDVINDRIQAELPVSGVYQYEMHFFVADSYEPITIIIATGQGAIHGELIIRSAHISNAINIAN